MPLTDRYVPGPQQSVSDGSPTQNMSVINNPWIRRPFFDDQDRPCVIANTGQWTVEKGVRVPIRRQYRIADLIHKHGQFDPVWLTANASALRKEQWIEMDRRLHLVARPRLKAWADLAAANPYGGFNGMARMTLEYEAMNDPGEAIVDMDAMTEGRTDAPLFKLRSLPLPITHSDFWFSQRLLDISGNGGTPFNFTMAEAAGRRIAEMVERTTIGIEAGVSYGYNSAGRTAHDISAPDDGHGAALGGSTVYGYTTYPHRLVKTDFTDPSVGTFVPDTTHNEVLAAIEQLQSQNFFGPYMLYHSRDWTQYMNRVYAVVGGNNPGDTLRGMLLKNPDIVDVRRLDFLTSDFTFILVQMTSEVAQAVIGLGMTTVQWPSVGGLRQNFKVMCINVPFLQSDYTGQCGILHGTTT